MRRSAFLILSAIVTLCATTSISYVILDHFYGEEVVATSTRAITIENFGQQVTIENVTFEVENTEYLAQEKSYRLYIFPTENVASLEWLQSPHGTLTDLGLSSVDVPSAAYERALETGDPVTVSDTITVETKPINALPIAAGIGALMSFIVFGVWVGYRRLLGDATSTLVDYGLRDMTVRDVEIVGEMIEMKEFTIPELMKRTSASKLKVWRTLQKLIQKGIVKPTEKTRPAANGLGGRGKPSRIYKYVGAGEKRE
jgi:hypothetical protein